MSRPRGYADWSPKDDTLALIDQVNAILHDYEEYLPMTARQIFYRLVGAYNFDKTEKAYARLCEHLVRARRAGMIRFSAIRDDKVTSHSAGGGYDDPAQFWRTLRKEARYYSRPTREGQDYHIELWTEASGMSEMIAGIARPYGVPVYSAGGFPSVTATHAIAQRALAEDKPTIALHIGDYDPSGESIFSAMMMDALHFYGAEAGGGTIDGDKLNFGLGDDFRAIRIALTWEQVREHGIDTAPPKKTDGRSKQWAKEGRHETAQAEAIDPPLLRTMVEEALEEWTDMNLLRQIEEVGEEEQEVIDAKLKELISGDDD
jgi:hypothetical protein